MAILRNIQIARRYNITPATVGNWIEQAKHRRINLELTTVKGRFYIEDTDENHQEIKKLKQQGLKFRAKPPNIIKVKPDPRIYDIFTNDQLISIYTNMAYYNLIPVKFSYFAEGANYQDEFYSEAAKSESSTSRREFDTIKQNLPSILNHFLPEDSINIVEFGTGNSSNIVKVLSDDLISQNRLERYVSICTSSQMLNLRKNYFSANFSQPVKSHKVDIEEQVVRNILFTEKNALETRNLCLVLQAFLGNVRNQIAVLENLSESISNTDYLLVGLALTSDGSQSNFTPPNKTQFYKKHGWLLDLLGLSKYIEVENYTYDSNNRTTNSYFTLRQDLELKFTIDGVDYPLLLERDRKINYFINKRFTLQEFIGNCDIAKLSIEQFNISSDSKYGLFLLKPAKRITM